jgi:hypothetical protein
MNPSRSTYHSNIYREFRSLDISEWRTVVRFYELYEDKIAGLEFEESFDMLLAYAEALFEIGDYERHLRVADQVLELSVMNNIKFFNGEDVFQKTLFKKAASNYSLYEFEKCDYLLRELLRIDPYDSDGALFLKKCLRDMRSNLVKKTRAASVLLLIISAIIICFELLAVHSFYPAWAGAVAFLRNVTLGLTVLVLVGGELYHRLRSYREVDNFVEHLRRRKK